MRATYQYQTDRNYIKRQEIGKNTRYILKVSCHYGFLDSIEFGQLQSFTDMYVCMYACMYVCMFLVERRDANLLRPAPAPPHFASSPASAASTSSSNILFVQLPGDSSRVTDHLMSPGRHRYGVRDRLEVIHDVCHGSWYLT